MRIQNFERVVYRTDPLAEVVCQVRFGRMEELRIEQAEALVAELAALGYVKLMPPKIQFQLNLRIVQSATDKVPEAERAMRGYQYGIEDESVYVAWNAESISIVCNKYPGWGEFKARFLAVTSVYRRYFPECRTQRMGLRYKDIIKREAIGLVDRPWHELIKPFLLGPLSLGAFADDEAISIDDVLTALTQGIVKLDDCMLVLQSALLREKGSQSKTAFLIDSDFFIESIELRSLVVSGVDFEDKLNVLHQQAGAMFKRGITDELHNALGPQ